MDFSFDNVTIRGGFWADMQKKNREVTIPAVYARFSETGRIKGLTCCRFEDNPEAPHIFWDSDVANGSNRRRTSWRKRRTTRCSRSSSA